MSKLLKLTMTNGRSVLVSVKAAYDAGPHRVINEDEGCACHAVLETLDEIAELNKGTAQELTIRDQFAMSAMNGILANGEKTNSDEVGMISRHAAKVSLKAYAYADAMIKARESK